LSTRSAAATKAQRTTTPRTGKTRVHRRVSGPAPPRRTGTARASATRAAATPAFPRLRPVPALNTIAARSLRIGRTLQDSPMLDRLLRGRMWIGLLGVLLIGLVALNVSLLKLNAAAGRNAEWVRKLSVENADLHAHVARLASGDRLQAEAAARGFVMPSADEVHYLNSSPTVDARRAAKRAQFVAPSSTSDIVGSAPAESSLVPATAPIAPAAPTQSPTPSTTQSTTQAAPSAQAQTPAPAVGTTGGTTGAATPAPPATPATGTTP
jgi:hypothetical protein